MNPAPTPSSPDPHRHDPFAPAHPPGGGMGGTTPDNAYARPAEPHLYTRAPDGRPMEVQPAWRHDFPIDWPQDHYVSRRDFTKFLVLISGAFVVGQLWIGAENWRRNRRGRPPIRKVASLSQLPVGGHLVFRYPNEHDDCILIRPDEQTLLAYSQKCTHLSCAVIPRVKDQELFCPCHEGHFDLSTGRPIAGPPRRPLPRIRIERKGDDIYATDVEVRTT